VTKAAADRRLRLLKYSTRGFRFTIAIGAFRRKLLASLLWTSFVVFQCRGWAGRLGHHLDETGHQSSWRLFVEDFDISSAWNSNQQRDTSPWSSDPRMSCLPSGSATASVLNDILWEGLTAAFTKAATFF